MARKTGKNSNAAISEPEEKLESVQATESADRAPKPRAMSKAGAARAALADGYLVPREAIIHIKETYGIDMSPQQFSAEKCRLKARGVGEPDFGFLKELAGSKQDGVVRAARRPDLSEPDLLESLEVMKPLIDRLGAEKVKRMVDLLG